MNEPFKRILAIKMVVQGWKVDQLQVEELRDAIFTLVMGYAAPDYATYAKFRFPVEDVTWNARLVEFNKGFLAKIFPDRAAEFADMSPRELFEERFYYTLIQVPTQSRRRASVDESLRTVGVIREMAADASLIAVENRTTMPPPLYEIVVSTANNGISQALPSCLITPWPDAVLESEGTLDVATIRLMLKTRNDPGMPHFFRFYWLPKEQKWAPYEYCVASSTRDHFVF